MGIRQQQGRSDAGFEKMADMNLAYIDELSFLMDLKVVAKTALTMLDGKGAC